MIFTAIPSLSRDFDCKAGILTQGCQRRHIRVIAVLRPLKETTPALSADLCSMKAGLLPPLGCECTNQESREQQKRTLARANI